MSFFNRQSSRQVSPDYSVSELVRRVSTTIDRLDREYTTDVQRQSVTIRNPLVLEHYKNARRQEFRDKARRELGAITNTADIKLAYKSLPSDEPLSKSVLMDALEFLDQPLGQ